jgi:hypothetical protein
MHSAGDHQAPEFTCAMNVFPRFSRIKALMADSKQTELFTYLSAILLAGLLLNALLGWLWADPVAALDGPYHSQRRY